MCIFYGSAYIWLNTRTIDLSGDIKQNPGPKPSSFQNCLICHWKLNSKTAHSYVEIPLLRAYPSAHKFDIVCEKHISTPVSMVSM